MVFSLKQRNPQINRRNALANGLIAFWPLSDGGGAPVQNIAPASLALSGNKSFATFSGSKANTTIPGRYGPAISGAANTSLNLSTPIANIPPAGTSFTVAGWIKYLSSAANEAVIDWRSAVTTSGSVMYIAGTTGLATLFSATSNGTLSVTIAGTVSLNDGNWHHLAATTATGSLILYVDGVAVANTNSSHIGVEFDAVLMGNAYSGGAPFPAIDMVGVWNRILSPFEIYSLYSNPLGLMNPPRPKTYFCILSSGVGVSSLPGVSSGKAGLSAKQGVSGFSGVSS